MEAGTDNICIGNGGVTAKEPKPILSNTKEIEQQSTNKLMRI